MIRPQAPPKKRSQRAPELGQVQPKILMKLGLTVPLCIFFCASLFNPFWASPGPLAHLYKSPACFFLRLTKKLILRLCNKWWKLLETHTPFFGFKTKGSVENRIVSARLGRSITQSRRTEMPRKRRCRHLPVSRFNVQDE
jgi:hypothetical protein